MERLPKEFSLSGRERWLAKAFAFNADGKPPIPREYQRESQHHYALAADLAVDKLVDLVAHNVLHDGHELVDVLVER